MNVDMDLDPNVVLDMVVVTVVFLDDQVHEHASDHDQV